MPSSSNEYVSGVSNHVRFSDGVQNGLARIVMTDNVNSCGVKIDSRASRSPGSRYASSIASTRIHFQKKIPVMANAARWNIIANTKNATSDHRRHSITTDPHSTNSVNNINGTANAETPRATPSMVVRGRNESHPLAYA